MDEEQNAAGAQSVQTAYLNDLRRVLRPLTAAQRRELHTLMTTQTLALRNPRDRAEARALLWEDATRLVLAVAARFSKRYGWDDVDMDLVQEGNLAAGKAVDTWDPEKGAFSTWVVSNVRGAMLDYLNESNKGGVGSKSSDAVIVGMDEGVAYAPETTGTTDTPGAKQEGAMTRGELLTYDGVQVGDDLEGSSYTPQGFETADTIMLRTQVCRVLQSMDPLDAYVLRAYYGIGEGQKTLAEIASETGYSVSGIRKRITLSKHRVSQLVQNR